MQLTLTFGWWMLPLAFMWACLLWACIKCYDDPDIWLMAGTVGGVITIFSLLARFLP